MQLRKPEKHRDQEGNLAPKQPKSDRKYAQTWFQFGRLG